MLFRLRKIMNTEYYLPLSKSSTYWHAAYFFIWCQVFLYICHRQCKQCISSSICSQPQFSSDPTDQPSFLLLPFSRRAASPTFLLPTSFLLWKQSKTEKCTYLFNLLLMFMPRLYCLPWRSHLENSKNLFSAERKAWSAKSSLCWGSPMSRRCAELVPAIPPLSCQEVSPEMSSLVKDSEKDQTMYCGLGIYKQGRMSPLLSYPEHLDKPLLHYTTVLHDLFG